MSKEILNNNNGVLSVDIPSDSKKREQMIKALEYQIAQDTNDKDRELHQRALKALKEAV